MRYPEFLKEKGSIGFIAPSFGCNIEPYRSGFDNAQKVLSGMGHKLLFGENVYAGDGIGISTSPDKCGRELMDMVLSDDCDVIISCGGGELMCETMEHVDFEAISAAKPKWYMGYSDNTNMTFLLATLADTAAIYGPCAPAFGMEPWHRAIWDAYRVLRGDCLDNSGYPLYELESAKDEEHPLLPYNCTEPRKIQAWTAGFGLAGEKESGEIRFNGRLIGGCLDILAMLCGTKFDRVEAFTERYREDGFIWFLEACDLSVFSIRRAVWQLKNAGWFRYVKGFLIGRPLAGQEDLMGLDHIRAVTDVLAEFGVPILLDLDIGHLPPMMPLITGSVAEVAYTPKADSFRIMMNLR